MGAADSSAQIADVSTLFSYLSAPSIAVIAPAGMVKLDPPDASQVTDPNDGEAAVLVPVFLRVSQTISGPPHPQPGAVAQHPPTDHLVEENSNLGQATTYPINHRG